MKNFFRRKNARNSPDSGDSAPQSTREAFERRAKKQSEPVPRSKKDRVLEAVENIVGDIWIFWPAR